MPQTIVKGVLNVGNCVMSQLTTNESEIRQNDPQRHDLFRLNSLIAGQNAQLTLHRNLCVLAEPHCLLFLL